MSAYYASSSPSPVRNGTSPVSPAEEGFALMRSLVQEHKTVIAGLRKDFAAREADYQATIGELLKSLQGLEQDNDDLRRDVASARSAVDLAHLERAQHVQHQRETAQRVRLTEVNVRNAVETAAGLYSNWYQLLQDSHYKAVSALYWESKAAVLEQNPPSARGMIRGAVESAGAKGAEQPKVLTSPVKVLRHGGRSPETTPLTLTLPAPSQPLGPEDVVLFVHTSAVELSDATRALHKGGEEQQQSIVDLVRQQLLRCAEVFCAATASVKKTAVQSVDEDESVDFELLLDDWVADVARPLVYCLESVRKATAADGEKALRRALYRLSQVAESKRLVLQSGAMNRAKQAAVAVLASRAQSPTSTQGSFGDSEIPLVTVSQGSPTQAVKQHKRSKRTHFRIDPAATSRSDYEVPDAMLTTSEVFDAGESSDEDVLYVEDDFSFRGSRVAMLTKAQRHAQGAVMAFRYLGSELEGMDMENVLRMTMTADTTVMLHREGSTDHEEEEH